MTEKIQFNRPFMMGKELYYIAKAKFGTMPAGDGPFTKRCHEWLEHKSGCEKGLFNAFMHCRAGDGCLAAGY